MKMAITFATDGHLEINLRRCLLFSPLLWSRILSPVQTTYHPQFRALTTSVRPGKYSLGLELWLSTALGAVFLDGQLYPVRGAFSFLFLWEPTNII